MCGIVGYVSTSDRGFAREKRLFLRDALILDTFRGMDSTGLFTVNEDRERLSAKTLKQGWDFVRSKDFIDMEFGWAAVGHNRAATRGKVILENAHPFQFESVTLVHNGTLRDDGRSLPTYDRKFHEVDSAQLCRALGSVPMEDAKRVLESINGAFAIVWHDARDDSLNMARNNDRPLHFSWNQTKTVMWFMSEGHHLSLIKKRRWCMASDMGAIYSLKTYQHFKWKRGSLVPEVADFRPFVYPRYNQGGVNEWSSPSGAPATSTPMSPANRSSRSSNESTDKRTGGGGLFLTRMFLNGRIVAIPEAILEDLRDNVEIGPEDTLRFRPDQWFRYPYRRENDSNIHGYAIGYVWLPKWGAEVAAIVHNIRDANLDAIKMESWEVVPYGVTTDCPYESGFCIVAKVKKFEVPEHLPWGELAPSEDDFEDEDQVTLPTGFEDEEDEDDGSVELFPGPDGKLFLEETWLKMVQHGCMNCSRDIDTDEAEDIWWVGEYGNDPLCPSCCDLLTRH